MALDPCRDLSPAAWITSAGIPWHQLVTFGPQAFESYAHLRFLPDPDAPGQEEADALVDPDVPGEDDLLGRALTVLGDHTHTPDDEYFCVWDGWGRPPSLKGMPVVAVPHRRYLMFRGTLTDYADWVSPGTAGLAAEGLAPPALIWPADRAWCVARDVDPHYAGIGATRRAVARLVAHPVLDVVPADPTRQQPTYGP